MQTMLRGRTKPSYGHALVPTLIELRCPNCSGMLRVTHPSHTTGATDTPDGWFLWSRLKPNWRVDCTKCLRRRSNVSYDELPDLGALYYSASVGTDELWAWNREHLEMLLAYLRYQDVASSRWRAYKTFIPGRWKSPRRRSEYVKAAERLLANCP